jgi:methylaspartate mutase epsilon subunit
MRAGLEAVRTSGTPAVGTLTIDSYTRCGDYRSVERGLAQGDELNGYPIVSYPPATTKAMLAELMGPDFPVQVRHGTPDPRAIFRRMAETGLDATEGGPVSYCLPYGKTPLAKAVVDWREGAKIIAGEMEHGHIESFGGCMLGQLCPPSLLIAINILECLFFQGEGVRSVSLSFAQGTNPLQDRAALAALRELAARYLGDIEWHVVVYTYMGLFPRTRSGARRLIADSARLAAEGGAERLIVKTQAERRQIPAVEENTRALRIASRAADGVCRLRSASREEDTFREEVLTEAAGLLEAILGLSHDVGAAILEGFRRGLLDVPFCLHPDNAGSTRAVIDPSGALRWGRVGHMPVFRTSPARLGDEPELTSDRFLAQLSYLADRYDVGTPTETEGLNA